MYAPPRTITYDTADPRHCTADIYTPRNARSPRDALIFIHGGAWRSGDKSDHADLPALLADAYTRHGDTRRPLPTVIIPNYRLSANPAFPDRHAVAHPTHTHDVAAALCMFVTTCPEWQDIGNVVLAGHSCGAHILSHILFTLPFDDSPATATPPAALRPSLDHLIGRTHAVAFLDGITSVRALAREYPGYAFFIKAAFGVDPHARWEGADAFTEERAVSRQAAAALQALRKIVIAHASADELLTPAQGKLFRDHLARNGFADVLEWDEQTLQGTHDGCLHDKGVGELLYRLLA